MSEILNRMLSRVDDTLDKNMIDKDDLDLSMTLSLLLLVWTVFCRFYLNVCVSI